MSDKVDPQTALASIPAGLRAPLLEEYNKVARHFRERRREPAELNGGKFCEVVYSILKGHVDGAFPANPTKPRNMLEACRALENATASFPRSVRIQIPRLLVALYEIRNNRNVGHVGADVDPNHMDAAVVLAMVKWVLADLVRVFHGIKTDEATAIVESLTERSIPIVWQAGGKPRVLGKLSVRDKTLILLFSAPGPMAVSALLTSLEYSNGSRYRSVVLKGAHQDDLLHFDVRSDTAEISPIGTNYVETVLPLELPA